MSTVGPIQWHNLQVFLNIIIAVFAEMTTLINFIKNSCLTFFNIYNGRGWCSKWRKYLWCTFSYICVLAMRREQSWEMNLLLGKHLISKSNSGSRDLYNAVGTILLLYSKPNWIDSKDPVIAYMFVKIKIQKCVY